MEDKKIVTETDMMRAESVSGGTSSPCDENISGKSANGSQLIVKLWQGCISGNAACIVNGSLHYAVDTRCGDRTCRRGVVIFPSDEFLCLWYCDYTPGGIFHEVSDYTGTFICTTWSAMYDRCDHGS